MKKIGIFIFLLMFAGVANGKQVNLKNIKSVVLHIYDQKAELQDGSRSKFVLSVFINGVARENHIATYKVSPGMLRDRFEVGKEPELTPESPRGGFYPTRLEIDHVSGQFGGKALGIFETGKMPYSIFFHNGFAIHGSQSIVDGRPASKGCVRLKVKDAKNVFSWVTAAIANTGDSGSVSIHIDDTESNYVREFRRKKT